MSRDVREMRSEKRAQKFHTDDASLPRSGLWHFISMEFLYSFLRPHFGDVAWNVGCFLRLRRSADLICSTYVQVCMPQQQKAIFFVCVVKNRVWRFFAFNSCDFSQFFVMLIITEVQSELAIITKFAKIAKNRKSDDFLCYLPFCTVLCHVNNH